MSRTGYIIWIQDPIFNGIKLGLTDEDIENCADEVGLTKGKLLSQSLLPKSLGRGIEPSFMDFVNLVKKGKKMAQKVENRPAFMEGIPKELSRAAEVVNEPFLRKSELPSANFHASAKSLAKLSAMMANFGEGLEGNQRLMTHETWLKMHANEKRAFDAAMHGIKSVHY